jgi:hypothetical protein
MTGDWQLKPSDWYNLKVSFDTWNNGKNVSRQESELSIWNEGTSYKRNMPPIPNKQTFTNVSEPRKQRRILSQGSYIVPMDQVCRSRAPLGPTISHLHQKDEKGLPVTGVGRRVSCTDIRAKTVHSPINIATNSNQGSASSRTTMEGIIPSSITLKPVPIMGIMRTSSSLVSMPRRNRLNTNGNGPDAFGQNSPVRRMVHWSDEIGETGSVTEAETERRVGSGALFTEDSKKDLPSQTGSRPWTGGDDTILTPFSLSPMTGMAVDSLPELFLAYCTLANSDDVMSDDDRVVPRGSDLDPIPLLTGCTLSLSSSFLSRSRQ